MFTNTFVPHLGGVTRSILTLQGELERRGHRVMIIAPSYNGHDHDTSGVIRVPSIHDVAGYATPIPMARYIRDEIEAFGPDIVHAHHPFLLGDTALRTAASLGVPAVYSAHTRYDHYLGPSISDNGRLARLARELTNGFANLADAVIAPSESMRDLLQAGGVTSPIRIVPTGIDTDALKRGDGATMRARLGLGPETFVVGHLGRLSDEKNLDYLGEAVALFLAAHPTARFVLAGLGPKADTLRDLFAARGLARQVHLLGTLEGADLAGYYSAIDVFAFSSLSETQGLVVAEAMAAGTPVVALDASGVREAVAGDTGGTLLPAQTPPAGFAAALATFAELAPDDRAERSRLAQRAAKRFSIGAMGDAVEALYGDLIAIGRKEAPEARRAWEATWDGFVAEVDLVENLLRAIGAAVRPARDDAPSDWEAGHAGRKLAVALLSGFWALVLRVWRASWRVDARDAAKLDAEIAQGARLVAMFWHGNYLPLFTLLAGRSALVTTSRSFRGAVIAAIARRFGYRTVQVGGGHRASPWLRAELAHPGGLVAIAADGPLGPRHEVKPGGIAIAAQTGARILPVAAIASAQIRLTRRWDRMELPLPFARVTLRVGTPLEIGPAATADIEATARTATEHLNALRPEA